MSVMNGKFHLTLPSEDLIKLREEAEELEISVAELIRRKLESPPQKEELVQLRKLNELIRKENAKTKDKDEKPRTNSL